MPFPERIKVWDLLDFLSQPDWLAQIQAQVKQPLQGLSVVSYYGCMANRPPKITGAGQHENPQNMDTLLKALGATVPDWSYKTDCCGASHTVSRPDIVHTLVQRLYERALEAGAEAIVVSCQMCQANLDMPQAKIAALFQKKYDLPIYYFTELIGVAWQAPEAKSWLNQTPGQSPSPLAKKGSGSMNAPVLEGIRQEAEKVGAVMVLGAGISGMQSALDLANAGFKVFLVDKNVSIGGIMAQLDKTFPTNDCSTCMISPKLIEVAGNPNIEIITRSRLKTIGGEPGNFQVTILKEPRYIDEEKCNACGICTTHCPVRNEVYLPDKAAGRNILGKPR